ncbi:hypothetical protein AHF37_06153 [Paragonimus kellicotti]|nr:hypothetical protein AHF37_06153 [Paragonimus kellicotti]
MAYLWCLLLLGTIEALNVRTKTVKRVINGSPAPDGQVPWAGQMKATDQNMVADSSSIVFMKTQTFEINDIGTFNLDQRVLS